MRLKNYVLIARLTGDRPIPVYRRLRDWTGERNGTPLENPIMVEAYIASSLACRVPMESGKEK